MHSCLLHAVLALAEPILRGLRLRSGARRVVGVDSLLTRQPIALLVALAVVVAQFGGALASGQPAGSSRSAPAAAVVMQADSAGSCAGLVATPDGSCTHGPDPKPPGTDSSPATPVVSAATLDQQVSCDGDGTSGKRVQVLYLHASDKPDRYTEFLDSFRVWSANTDAVFVNSAAKTGGVRHIRFVTEPDGEGGCRVIVPNVEVGAAGDDNFDNSVAALKALGWNSATRHYLVFRDAGVICGQADSFGDSRHAAANMNNGGPAYALVDSFCWDTAWATAHELGHTLGAVQDDSPNTSHGGHCIDVYDVMCYADGPSAPPLRFDCEPEATYHFLLDCNDDDYFNTNPPPGSYLATHWNIADNQFLIGASDPPAPAFDDFAKAIPASARPFVDQRDVQAATSAGDDPTPPSNCDQFADFTNSVWYKTKPAVNGKLFIDTEGSGFDTYLTVWRGSRGSLTFVGCRGFGFTNPNQGEADLEVDVQAGVTYFIMVNAEQPLAARTLKISIDGASEVQPGVTVSKVRGTVNETVAYSLTGWPANVDVKVQWQRTTGSKIDVLTVRTNGSGSASGTFKVPATPGGTANKVLFVQGGVSKSVSFEVVARIKVTPDPAQRGQTIDISLRGYSRGEVVKIRWKRGGGFVQVGQVTTSNTGSANLRIPVPGWVPDGEHSVRGDGTVFRQQTNGVTISGGPPVSGAEEATSTPTPQPTATPTLAPTAPPLPTSEATETAEPTSTATTEPTTSPEPTATVTVEPIETATEVPAPPPPPPPVPTDAVTPEAA